MRKMGETEEETTSGLWFFTRQLTRQSVCFVKYVCVGGEGRDCVTLSILPWVASYLPLISCLTRHIRCWEAPKAVLHRGSPERASHLAGRGISSQGHGVLRVVVQIVVVREQRRLVETAVVGVRNQIRGVLHVPSAGDSRNILNDHTPLWKENQSMVVNWGCT